VIDVSKKGPRFASFNRLRDQMLEKRAIVTAGARVCRMPHCRKGPEAAFWVARRREPLKIGV
jgi:hypothetical protein